MTGHRNFMAKAIDLVMDMDKMIGTEFEKGLAALDTATAKAGAVRDVAGTPASRAVRLDRPVPAAALGSPSHRSVPGPEPPTP
jgi:hypothetical protein